MKFTHGHFGVLVARDGQARVGIAKKCTMNTSLLLTLMLIATMMEAAAVGLVVHAMTCGGMMQVIKHTSQGIVRLPIIWCASFCIPF